MVFKSAARSLRLFLIVFGCLSFIMTAGLLSAAEEIHHHHEDHGHLTRANSSHEISVRLETKPDTLETGKEATILFHLMDEDGNPLQGLTMSHDRLLHVMIISADFTGFAHIHPEDFGTITQEMKKTAGFPVRYSFPKAGRYLIALDMVVGETMVTKRLYVMVNGAPRMGAPEHNLAREKKFGDYAVQLTTDPGNIHAGEKAKLIYRITRSGEPVTDLEPYLSAPMHIAVLLADLNNFIHAHGEIPGSSSGHDPAGHVHGTVQSDFGPEIEATIVFPVRGLYKVFSEIKHRGKVILFDFMVEVE
ncbi:MAG: hypothetical protein ACM34I_00610 [bacterium]